MQNDIAVNIGSEALKARKALGLTQRDVAERIGIATEVYGRLERGHMLPSVRTLRSLCRTLNVSSDVLMGISTTTPTAEYMVVEHEHTRNVVKLLNKMTPKGIKLVGQLARALLNG